MNPTLHYLLLQSQYSMLLQFGVLLACIAFFLSYIYRTRKESMYTKNRGWLIFEVLVTALIFFVMMRLFFTGWSAEGAARTFRIIGACLLYLVAWITLGTLDNYKKGFVSLRQEHVYFFETDWRLIHRVSTLMMLLMLSVLRSI